MPEAVIVSAVRTPIGKFAGGLKDLSAPQLGALVVREAVRRAGLAPEAIDECIMGNVISAGLGQNPARQAALWGGLPDSVAALTINKVCGSGLKAAMLAADAILAGKAEAIVAGGMESMSNGPYLLEKARFGYRLFDGKLVDATVRDGLWDVFNDFHMGNTGEIVAERYHVTRDEADTFALESHRRAVAAQKAGKFAKELLPVEVETKEGSSTVSADEGPREATSLEALAKLKPVFKPDGIVTAGNASTINDGAAALVVMEREAAREASLRPLATIVDYCTGGVKPEWIMEAPIPTTRRLLERAGLRVQDIELFEHNEAFATASCAVRRELGIPADRFNVHGGAVSLGHPIGASGARLLTTLLYALEDRGAHRGLATLCLGGGNAVSMIVQR